MFSTRMAANSRPLTADPDRRMGRARKDDVRSTLRRRPGAGRAAAASPVPRNASTATGRRDIAHSDSVLRTRGLSEPELFAAPEALALFLAPVNGGRKRRSEAMKKLLASTLQFRHSSSKPERSEGARPVLSPLRGERPIFRSSRWLDRRPRRQGRLRSNRGPRQFCRAERGRMRGAGRNVAAKREARSAPCLPRRALRNTPLWPAGHLPRKGGEWQRRRRGFHSGARD